MSRIFKISGNFMQHEKWSEPDPSFSGKIVVDDNDEFYGYCDELYSSSMSEVNRIRYLAGALTANGQNGRQGIAFFKMSNDKKQAPLMYMMPDLTDPKSGSWAALSPWGIFVTHGAAKITVEEEAFSEEEERNIKAKYDAIDKDVNFNDELLGKTSGCKSIVVHSQW